MESCILEYINKCLLCKLSKEYHENDDHSEFIVRNKNLNESFPQLISLLDQDLNIQFKTAPNVLAHILILNLELQSDGPWNSENTKHKEHLEEINEILINKHKINLNDVLHSDLFNCQVIFDTCIMELHKKMTIDDFRKYPSMIEVYCILSKNLKVTSEIIFISNVPLFIIAIVYNKEMPILLYFVFQLQVESLEYHIAA